jgi:Rrf2 family protein
MKLTKASAQAALAMAFLAERCGDGLVQTRQVAEHLSVPTDSALKILQALARQGLIRSQLGRAGGYALDRPADQITLLDVFEAIDGPITAAVPVSEQDPALAPAVQTLQRVADRAVAHIRAEWASTTIASLALRPVPVPAAG